MSFFYQPDTNNIVDFIRKAMFLLTFTMPMLHSGWNRDHGYWLSFPIWIHCNHLRSVLTFPVVESVLGLLTSLFCVPLFLDCVFQQQRATHLDVRGQAAFQEPLLSTSVFTSISPCKLHGPCLTSFLSSCLDKKQQGAVNLPQQSEFFQTVPLEGIDK